MGKYIQRVGKYYAQYGDYQWDKLKYNRPLEYYQKHTFEIEIENVETGGKETIKVPILDNFIEVELVKKNYTFKHKDGNTLLIWLFNYVKKKGRIFCKPFVLSSWEDAIRRRWKEFYLDSKLREPIVLKEVSNNVVELKDIEDLFWLQNNGLVYIDWVDEQGNNLEKEDE